MIPTVLRALKNTAFVLVFLFAILWGGFALIAAFSCDPVTVLHARGGVITLTFWMQDARERMQKLDEEIDKETTRQILKKKKQLTQ